MRSTDDAWVKVHAVIIIKKTDQLVCVLFNFIHGSMGNVGEYF